MKKILFVATIDQHIRHFHYPFLEWFKSQGYEVHVASKGDEKLEFVDRKFNVCFSRNPFKLSSIVAYYQIKNILKNGYDLVHFHTPTASVIGRLASINYKKKGLRTMYTAHGFHFFHGAPQKNWLIYYPIEKYLARFTDVLITMNDEDYKRSLLFKTKSIFINGVGINTSRFSPVTESRKAELRDKYGISRNLFVLIYVAELSHRKNQKMLIDAFSRFSRRDNSLLLLVGNGPQENKLKKQVLKLSLNKNIRFLGYRKDIPELLNLSDMYVSTSKQEGLPVNILESMASGTPILATPCRGNVDLIENNINGWISKGIKTEDFIESMEIAFRELDSRRTIYSYVNSEKVDKYKIEIVKQEMKKIYSEVLKI